MNPTTRHEKPLVAGRDFPKYEGRVRMVLHNCKNHTDDFVYENHNDPTNALADIFSGNYGGLVNYDNFADLFSTWLGGVLVFKNLLDPSVPANYGIPDRLTNEVVAHAGQTPIGSEGYGDDTSRGNPDNTGTVKTSNSTTLVWEWGSSQGNANQIYSLGLTHSDVGSFGCGVDSIAQRQLNPFADVGCLSKSYAYADDGVAPFGVNNDTAYSFYIYEDGGSTKVKIYISPMNVSKFKLQGGSLAPLTDYKTTNTVTLSKSYGAVNHSECYYHWDFTNNALILFGVKTEGGVDLYKDTISLSDWSVTHEDITVSGVKLWKFTGQDAGSTTGYSNTPLSIPTKAMIYDGCVYVYGNTGTGDYEKHPSHIYAVNLSNSDVDEVDVSDLTMTRFDGQGYSRTAERFATLGGIIVHDSFLINGGKAFEVNAKEPSITSNLNYGLTDSISSPVFGLGSSMNCVSVNKLYLATKFNLDSPAQKTSAQSMTIEYTLTEV